MEDKSWLVLGPGRTGSFAIVSSIYALYKYRFDIITPVGPGEPVRFINPSEVVHAHDPKWLDKVNENTEVIISTRNPVESALSWCIVPELGDFHFFSYKRADIAKLESVKNKKFYLDPEEFLSTYGRVISFYNQVQIKNSYHMLDYSEWSNDPKQILPKLGYTSNMPVRLPMKNPRSHHDWIENWEEISEICSTLPNNVNELFG